MGEPQATTEQESGDTSRPIRSPGADCCRQLAVPVCRTEQPGVPAAQAAAGLGTGSPDLPGGAGAARVIFGKSQLWQQHGESRGWERGGCARQGARHLPPRARPVRLHPCRGETEAAQESESSRQCHWRSAHLCCAHTGLCALHVPEEVPWGAEGEPTAAVGCGIRRFLGCCTPQPWETTSRKGSSWLCRCRCHRAPGALATATPVASPPGTVPAPNLPWLLWHPPASPPRGQGRAGTGVGKRGLGSALPRLPGLWHAVVPGKMC